MSSDKWKSYRLIICLIALGVLIFYLMFRDTGKGNTDPTNLIVATVAWLLIYIDYIMLRMKRQIADELNKLKKQLSDCTTPGENKQKQTDSHPSEC